MSEFPANNDQFEDVQIKTVQPCGDGGWSVDREDGWSFFVQADSPIEPKAGMTARLYGKGLGYSFRGLFLDGRKVFYRTEAEDKEHQDIQLYGKDAADLLARWDRGDSVFTIEMGGMGPGYEQVIHIAAFEILRILLDAQYDADLWEDQDVWKTNLAEIEKAAHPKLDALGMSGAQFYAAVNTATMFYIHGPREALKKAPDVRRIQVQREFPQAPAVQQ